MIPYEVALPYGSPIQPSSGGPHTVNLLTPPYLTSAGENFRGEGYEVSRPSRKRNGTIVSIVAVSKKYNWADIKTEGFIRQVDMCPVV